MHQFAPENLTADHAIDICGEDIKIVENFCYLCSACNE